VLVVEERLDHAVSDTELAQALDGRIPRWWMPDAIVRVAQMPLASTGKIDKQQLRRAYG